MRHDRYCLLFCAVILLSGSGCITVTAWERAACPATVCGVEGYVVDQATGRRTGIIVAYAVVTGFDNIAGFPAAALGFEVEDYVVVIPTDEAGNAVWPYRLKPTSKSPAGIWAETTMRQRREVEHRQLSVIEGVNELFREYPREPPEFQPSDSGYGMVGLSLPRPWYLLLDNCEIKYFADEARAPRRAPRPASLAINSPNTRYVLLPRLLPRPAEDVRKGTILAFARTPLLLFVDVMATQVFVARFIELRLHPDNHGSG